MFSVSVGVVTPILGGSSVLREVDEVDVIRPATVRGHLRFWWRALHGHHFSSSVELHDIESGLWGAAARDTVLRSEVEVRVTVRSRPAAVQAEVNPRTAYAMWPARKEKDRPAAWSRPPGTRFDLTLAAPAEHEAELREVVRAWLLFGGYGSRTRRGLGGFTVTADAADWLPGDASGSSLGHLFGRDIFAAPGRTAEDTPWLAGAALEVGQAVGDAVGAWTDALGWLQEFRQGGGPPGDRAREPGQKGGPSISNWPEADKVRRLKNKVEAHIPRHNAVPAWPRAAFGLPIVGRFQTTARDSGRLDEPGGFNLGWQGAGESAAHDRLASPLVVKALPLADGRFVPAALWLCRAHPPGKVVLVGVPGSEAPFDRLVATGERARFESLEGRGSLREAFLDWLRRRHHTTTVAP